MKSPKHGHGHLTGGHKKYKESIFAAIQALELSSELEIRYSHEQGFHYASIQQPLEAATLWSSPLIVDDKFLRGSRLEYYAIVKFIGSI